MRSEQQIAYEAEQARRAAERRIRAGVLADMDRWLDEKLAGRAPAPAFDTFWRLKGGVSALAIAAHQRAEAFP